MEIRIAEITEVETIRNLVTTTIHLIYPHYYPMSIVDFFIAHHNQEHIKEDISNRKVYVLEDKEAIIGTVTIHDAEIHRLFVSLDFQGKGYGGLLLDFAERMIASKHAVVHLDSSLPAKAIYLKRGYKEVSFHCIEAKNGDYLCYDLMQKRVKYKYE